MAAPSPARSRGGAPTWCCSAATRRSAAACRPRSPRESGGKSPEILRLRSRLARGDRPRRLGVPRRAAGRCTCWSTTRDSSARRARRTPRESSSPSRSTTWRCSSSRCGCCRACSRARPARIVNVSSDTYRMASLDFDDLQLERGYSFMRAYGALEARDRRTSRSSSRAGSRAAASRVNAVDPGPVASNIGANNPGLAYRIASPLIRHLFPSPERAARTALDAGHRPEARGSDGRLLPLAAKSASGRSRSTRSSATGCGESAPS